MKAIERLNETISKINEINESELSISEVDLLKFLKNQMMKSKNLFEAFSRSIDQKDWDNVLSYTFQILQRSNSIFGYLTQPTVLSLVSKSRLAGVIDNISDTLTFSVSEMIVVLKQNNKVLNIDSITINISSNPPSLSVSLVIKGG